ncbi:MAG: DUF4124 domain-containing protein [Thiofilum sp.]|uniref:DUF4124 domain-containing protein n=1 Tax=Thiofilum sp. TaxID=2212733 RepID=UPI0025E6B15A|nr:DUF4124 domain-containing protein [Thiofilum sp.]MBK8453942.1 DUF4124 domain-containing protein [Thiofilum sp.]
MKPVITLLVALAFSYSALNAQAEVYKWTDAQGKTHYSQTPPPNVKAKNMDAELYLHSSKASGKTPPTTKEPVVPEKDLPEIPKDLAEAKAKGEQDKKKVETFCTEQELSLKQMLANTLIRWKDEQGERLLTAEERDAKIKEAEKNLSTICTPEVLGKASAAGEKKD